MRLSSNIRSISYLKANAAALLERIGSEREPLVITQNGEAKAVLQDVDSWEETQETLALLKLIALGRRDVEAGRIASTETVAKRLREKRNRKQA
jgi:prevent-host-death family protein